MVAPAFTDNIPFTFKFPAITQVLLITTGSLKEVVAPNTILFEDLQPNCVPSLIHIVFSSREALDPIKALGLILDPPDPDTNEEIGSKVDLPSEPNTIILLDPNGPAFVTLGNE